MSARGLHACVASKLPRDHEDEVHERMVQAAATASPKTLLGDTVNQLTRHSQQAPSLQSLITPERADFSAAKRTRSPHAPHWAGTIRSSPEFANRMSELGLADTEGGQDQIVAELRTTVAGLEDENAALKDELEDVRRQDKEDLALAVRNFCRLQSN